MKLPISGNVVGHGIDLVVSAELKNWVDDPRDPFLSRCFSKKELGAITQGLGRLDTLAGRYAAKEAVLKALGTGFGAGIAFTDVIIMREPGCAPTVTLTGGAAGVAAKLGINRWSLSITHSGGLAIASAIALT